MPCLFGCLSLAFPRLMLFLTWLFGGDYLMRAYGHLIWPLLGFFFLPLTTLVFAYCMHSWTSGGQMRPFGWLLVAIAGAIDLGLLRGGSRSAKQWQASRRR